MTTPDLEPNVVAVNIACCDVAFGDRIVEHGELLHLTPEDFRNAEDAGLVRRASTEDVARLERRES